MDKGCGWHRTTKSHRGKWVEEDMATEPATVIKVGTKKPQPKEEGIYEFTNATT